MVVAFLHGLFLSLGLILPIGMQNGFLLTQGALHSRWRSSLPAVVTAALCDTLLIVLAVIGVSAAALHVAWLRYGLGAIGFCFLIWMGVSSWRDGAAPASDVDRTSAWTARRQIGFSASVSLLNPHALIDTLAVIGGSAAVYGAWSQRISFGLACIAVSWIWFIGLSVAGHVMGRTAVQRAPLRTIQRVSAIMMWLSGFYLVYVVYTYHG